MNLDNLIFKRKFCINPYKALKLLFGEMSFISGFISTERGDPYPLLSKDEGIMEAVKDNCYYVENVSDCSSKCVRLLGSFFPISTYSLKFNSFNGKIGLKIFDNISEVSVFAEIRSDKIKFCYSCNDISVTTDYYDYSLSDGILITFNGNNVEFYIQKDSYPLYITSLLLKEFPDLYSFPFPYSSALYVEPEKKERVSIGNVSWYLDNGISFADIKCIKNKDGSPYQKNDKIYFTATSRLISGGYQSVLSWTPGTSEFKLEGALLFNYNDGKIYSDIASSVVFDGDNNEFLIWFCSFSHGHILAYAHTDADIMSGIHILDACLMGTEFGNDNQFTVPYTGDEDPDFYYNATDKRWYLSICRLKKFDSSTSYSYYLFKSSDPFNSFSFVADTGNKSETGGSFVRINNKMFFVCGADFNSVSLYRYYDATDFSLISSAEFDYPDGGFRGWGTIIPIKCGNYNILYWITFDRKLFGDNNWSYGNLYLFECFY